MTENQSNNLQDPAEPKRVEVAVETTEQPGPTEPATETVVERTETVTEKPAE